MNGCYIYKVVVSPLKTNCYILKSKTTKNALVIDPGGDYPLIKAKLDSIGASCRVILLTHGHFDHILATDALRNKLTQVAIHKYDENCLYETDVFSSMIENDPRPMYPAEVVFTREGKYKIDEFEFFVLHTPGHTKGSVCYIIEDCIFTGDTLFKNSIGTTIFGGDDDELNESLKRLYYYPGDYALLPGHEEATTLSDARINNPFLLKFKKGSQYF